MPYCYCTPNRAMFPRHAVGEGTNPHSYYVTGSRGYDVSRRGRAIALKAWETRRRKAAEAKAAAEAARTRHMVIEGTPAPDAEPTRSLTLV